MLYKTKSENLWKGVLLYLAKSFRVKNLNKATYNLVIKKKVVRNRDKHKK